MKGGGPKLDILGEKISSVVSSPLKLEKRISANPVKGIDNAADKVMGSKVIQTVDKMTEATGAVIKKTGSFLATPVTGPVKKLGEVISKKLENTCDVVTTIQASDCEGNVINTVNLYGCITNNDLVPIIDVILNKMQIVLWPCISQKNNVIMKFLVNHVLHWFLFWFYIGCIFDIFKLIFEGPVCDGIDEHFEYTAPLIKEFYGICGGDSVFEHPLSDGWWDTDVHGRCDDNFYRKKCPYNNSKKDYKTDMTLWAGEEAKRGGSPGKKNGGFENPGEICDSFGKCMGSFGGGLGIGDGNAPRKYKECCEFNVMYITRHYNMRTKPGASMPIIPSGGTLLCDLDEFFAGAKELLKCAGEDVLEAGSDIVHSIGSIFGADTPQYHAENECKNIVQAIENKAHQEYVNCINARVKATGCGDYYQMVHKDGEAPHDEWGGPGWIHANNSIWQYIKEHPNEGVDPPGSYGPPQTDWHFNLVTGWAPAADGKSCDPEDLSYDEGNCLGPFREPTYKEKWIGEYDCMKDIPIFDFIKYLYRVIFLIFIFLWLFKITDGSSFGRVMIFILLGLYVWLRVRDYKKK